MNPRNKEAVLNLKHPIQRVHRMVFTISIALAGLLASVPVWSQSPSPTPPFGPPVGPLRTLKVADMTNPKPLIPNDVYRTPNPTEQDLATFAWLEFISAVSPASTTLRGVPGGPFASSGQPSSGPLVWETYQHRTELFPYN